MGTENRRVLWQGSYQSELLEHFCKHNIGGAAPGLTSTSVPSDVPGEIFPHTLHARHRPYTDPCDLELYVTFREPHRIRYTTGEGVVIHDQHIEVKYEFTMVEGSVRFQSDLRRKDLLDFFDVDIVWSDVQGRTDGFGNVRGMGLVQRLKLWRDRYTSLHSITVLANRANRHYHEYDIHYFDGEVRGRDDRGRQLRLNVRGARRGSSESQPPRRMSLSQRIRPRVRSSGSGSQSGSSASEATPANPLGIRYLGIQFTTRDREDPCLRCCQTAARCRLLMRHVADYRRFLERWLAAHSSDSEFNGVPFPSHRFELPSPQIMPGEYSGLPPVPEPPEADGDLTP